MSVTVSTFQQIHDSQFNTSSSKALYTFPKSKRIDPSIHSECKEAFYELPQVRSTRSAGIGYAKKFDFTKVTTKTPAPNLYDIEAELAKKQATRRGFSFGNSREKMPVPGGMFVGDKTSPGPGAYNVREINKKSIAFTFRTKATADVLVTNRKIPGPGAYELSDSFNKTGRYFLSNHKNSLAGIISPRTPRAGLYTENKTPGPGAYTALGSFSQTGTYFVSRFRSINTGSFGHAAKKSFSDRLDNVPGPGSYKLPSEFGHYENKNAKKFEEAEKAKWGSQTERGTSRVSTKPTTART